MSTILCTFSGKSGDILWSLPTAREIATMHGEPVDFFVMPYYESLVPLIDSQPYIDKAGVCADWIRTHSNHGDGPWQPPQALETGYAKSYHLTYRAHPGLNAPGYPLVDFIAWQQGIRLREQLLPFLTTEPADLSFAKPYVAYAFNEQYESQKAEFLQALTEQELGNVQFVDVTKMPWKKAARVIEEALVFVGCRSGCWVVANGVGQHTITFEPHPARHRNGSLGTIFSCPYGTEFALPFGLPARESAKVARELIWKRL